MNAPIRPPNGTVQDILRFCTEVSRALFSMRQLQSTSIRTIKLPNGTTQEIEQQPGGGGAPTRPTWIS